HERIVAELFANAGSGSDYLSLSESARVSRLAPELATTRPLLSPFLRYSEETEKELAIGRAARDIHNKYGPQALPHYIISKTDSVSDLLEVMLILRDARHPALRDHRRSSSRRRHHAGFPRPPRGDGAGARELGRRLRSDARLLRQQQGRR